LFILETKWGNAGYAFFYKLCELLGKKEGHAYDCNSPDAWEYLLAKTLLSGDTAIDILDKLSELGVINGDLWGVRIVWMQSFVDSIADVYNRRRIQKPLPPELPITEIPPKGINDNNNPTKATDNGISADSNPQSKGKESKVNKIVPPGFLSAETWTDFIEMRNKIKKPLTENACKLIFRELDKIKNQHGHDPNDVLEQSIRNDWQDVYPLKNKGGNNNQKTAVQPGASSPREQTYSICPNLKCKKEVLPGDCFESNCIHCAPRVPLEKIKALTKGIGKEMPRGQP
jgi:hypothetical protein